MDLINFAPHDKVVSHMEQFGNMFTHKWVAGKKTSCWQARWNVSSAKFQEKFHLQNTKKCFICKIPRKRRPWNSVTAWAWNIHIWVTDGGLRGVNESHCWGNESISKSRQTIHQDGFEANYHIHFIVKIHSSCWVGLTNNRSGPFDLSEWNSQQGDSSTLVHHQGCNQAAGPRIGDKCSRSPIDLAEIEETLSRIGGRRFKAPFFGCSQYFLFCSSICTTFLFLNSFQIGSGHFWHLWQLWYPWQAWHPWKHILAFMVSLKVSGLRFFYFGR